MHTCGLARPSLRGDLLRKLSPQRTLQLLAAERLSLWRWHSSQASRSRFRPRRGGSSNTLKRKGQRFSSVNLASDKISASIGRQLAADKQQEAQLSWQAIRALFVASAVPMVGFGFMDNLVSGLEGHAESMEMSENTC